jgi:hypothetical protein
MLMGKSSFSGPRSDFRFASRGCPSTNEGTRSDDLLKQNEKVSGAARRLNFPGGHGKLRHDHFAYRWEFRDAVFRVLSRVRVG